MKYVFLVYGANMTSELVGYANSDHGGDLLKRRSQTCYIFTLFGCAINRKSILQDITSLSITESEYMSIMEGVKEEIWL